VSRRLWVGAAAALAVLGLAAVVVVWLALDGIVQRGLERRGSEILGTAVHIDSVQIALQHGRGTVRGVHVTNPPGFIAPDALRLDAVTVEVDLLTLLSSPTIVRVIRLEAPQVFYEVNAQGGSNFDVIRHHIERTAGQPAAASTLPSGTQGGAPRAAGSAIPSPAPAREGRGRGGSGGSGRRYIVSLLALHDGKVQLDARATGGPLRSESLAGFELTGIGADRPGGATPRQVVRTVATALARDVAVSLAATQLEQWLGKDLGGVVGDVLKKGGAGAIGKGLDGVLEKLFKR
jgi:hypothetical protein